MNNFIKDVYTRYNTLVDSKNDAESICKKMNAEYNACFYNNKSNVYVSYVDESGKEKIQRLNG